MKLKGILLSILILFMIATGYLLYDLAIRKARPVQTVHLPEKLVAGAVQIGKILTLATSNDNINALTHINLINQGYTHVKDRLEQYSPLIDRITKDPATLNSGMDPLFITLSFLDHSLSAKDPSVRILMEWPLKKWLRKQLPYRFALRRRVSSLPKRKKGNPYSVFLTQSSIRKGLQFLKNARESYKGVNTIVEASS
ncbi:MAG TPA: hypothetical protein ENI73_03010 [Spirochaetes bacterium]|nr:hypothetical protein [Spirochaetota bacterium]